MTNTTSPVPALLVTSCPDHGVRVTSDLLSARVYVESALGCWASDNGWGDSCPCAEEGLDHWVCCDKMVIDPEGLFD